MFKIAEMSARSPFRPLPVLMGAIREPSLLPWCLTEEWTADPSDGTIRIGEWSAALHGLESGDCGLRNLTRAYPAADRSHVLGLFERAVTAPASFCFSTTLSLSENRLQPLFCIAQSLRNEADESLALSGVFIFPRFKLETGPERPMLHYA